MTFLAGAAWATGSADAAGLAGQARQAAHIAMPHQTATMAINDQVSTAKALARIDPWPRASTVRRKIVVLQGHPPDQARPQ